MAEYDAAVVLAVLALYLGLIALAWQLDRIIDNRLVVAEARRILRRRSGFS